VDGQLTNITIFYNFEPFDIALHTTIQQTILMEQPRQEIEQHFRKKIATKSGFLSRSGKQGQDVTLQWSNEYFAT